MLRLHAGNREGRPASAKNGKKKPAGRNVAGKGDSVTEGDAPFGVLRGRRDASPDQAFVVAIAKS